MAKSAPLFGSWLSQTRELQVTHFGRDYEALRADSALLGDTVQKQAGHLVWELGEMMAEYPGCKDWVTDRTQIDRERFLVEAVDALHFFANVLTALEFTDEQLCEAYGLKMDTNRARMESKTYDGVSDKCHLCHRELTDVVSSEQDPTRYVGNCSEHGLVGSGTVK